MDELTNYHSLEDCTPQVGEQVFVFDGFWREWEYATYEGMRSGKHYFLEGHSSCGEELFTIQPTHFWRVTLPNSPV